MKKKDKGSLRSGSWIMDPGFWMLDTGSRIRTFFISVLFISYFWGFAAGPDETAKQVATAIQAGNAADLTKFFNTMVDLTLPGYDDTYSKAQAGQILKEFFTKNPVKTFKVTNQGSSSDGSRYSIGSLEAGGKTFRVYFLIKTVNGQNLVHQMQMQENP
ncbi:MAG: DUF4783 domain-containing protein [Bacteroidales bacterium]|jgi:hypothetical protein|nr:DUF4783 domain-containing protein [Bacteroidales bacterium]